MKNLILENDNKLDEDIIELLEFQFKDNQEIWLQFRFAFWPENKEETAKKISSLKTGDNIICKTVFDGFRQMELMIDVLFTMIDKGIKINFYIMSNLLIDELTHYVKRYPWADVEEEKLRQNYLMKMKDVLNFHNIININREANFYMDENEQVFNEKCECIKPLLLGL